jgi:nucleotide-binding universal stress UspA family protein
VSIQRVLIALDFSSCAANVARRGGELARQLGARVSLIHVVPPPNVPLVARISVDDEGTREETTVEEYLRGSAERRLSRYADLAGAQDFAPRSVVRFGVPAETIIDEARASGAEMIIVGTRARTGLAHALYGSVAEEIVRGADVPVVTIRSQWTEGCAARSCNWCVENGSPEERRVDAEQYG